MNLKSMLVRPTKSLLVGILMVAVASLAVGWTARTVTAASGTKASAATAAPKGNSLLYAPGVGTTTTRPQADGATGSSGVMSTAIYPISGYNALGVAPAGTILAQGTGTADLKADGSNEAAALKKATDAALVDAHSQAAAAAASMGVALKEIYSTSIATTNNYVYPAIDCGTTAPMPLTPGKGQGSSPSGPVAPASDCTKPLTPTSTQLVVTLIVAYKYA